MFQSSKSLLLVAFVANFEDIFDSTIAFEEFKGELDICDLSRTLQFKMLITCGNFIHTKVRSKQNPNFWF